MKGWLGKLLSDSADASMSRTLAAIAMLFGCGWVTYLVFKTKGLPDLHGLAVFCGTPYALGKLGETVAKFKDAVGGGGQ